MRKKVNEAEAHIQVLGISPEDDLSNLCNKSIKWVFKFQYFKLWKNLNSFESQLQKSNINKKAAEDFINLSNERDKCSRNYEELDKSLNVNLK